jgi:hypothetical protein
MDATPIEQQGIRTIILIIASLGAILGLLSFLLWFGWKKEKIRGSTCPYCKEPMRLGIDVARSITNMVDAFMQEQTQPENPKIDFVTAAFCPTSGRIFPNCVGVNEQITLSWNFLNNRYKGTYVSWGSLSAEEQGILKLLHGSLEGYQTEQSSKRLRPEDVEEEFYSLAPGPLYVDRRERVVIGWKKVPGTYFEVLVVQRPRFQSLEETL